MDRLTGGKVKEDKMQKPDINRIPTSQMMALCQLLGLPQGGENETKAAMIANLEAVSADKWEALEVKFKVDQL